MDNLLPMGILLEIFSITCGLISYYSYHWGSKLTATTMGIIIKFEFSLLTGYLPVVEFVDSNGEQHYFRSGKIMEWKKPFSPYDKGDEIKVKYNPNKPSEAIIDLISTNISRIITALLLVITAIVFSFLGILLIGANIIYHPAFTGL